jgi:cob(I)alamin adenosyltransferase
MKIYTRIGDDGGTGLIGGLRVSKDHLRIEAYGTLDELSATLGLVCVEMAESEMLELLRSIQDDLFVIGAQLATTNAVSPPSGTITGHDVRRLEQAIDRYEGSLPPLRTFILPGGCRAAASLHLARVTCRRAERRVVTLSGQEAIAEPLIPYLNRLSDLLFVLARIANQWAAVEDIPWRKRSLRADSEIS